MHPLIKIPCPVCSGVDEYAPANDYEKCVHGVLISSDCWKCKPGHYEQEKAKANRVTGSNNPHYDFDRPVNNLQELVDVLDPNMDYKRYNILKSVIRWKEDEEYNYQKINYYSNPDLRKVPEKTENR